VRACSLTGHERESYLHDSRRQVYDHSLVVYIRRPRPRSVHMVRISSRGPADELTNFGCFLGTGQLHLRETWNLNNTLERRELRFPSRSMSLRPPKSWCVCLGVGDCLRALGLMELSRFDPASALQDAYRAYAQQNYPTPSFNGVENPTREYFALSTPRSQARISDRAGGAGGDLYGSARRASGQPDYSSSIDMRGDSMNQPNGRSIYSPVNPSSQRKQGPEPPKVHSLKRTLSRAFI